MRDDSTVKCSSHQTISEFHLQVHWTLQYKKPESAIKPQQMLTSNMFSPLPVVKVEAVNIMTFNLSTGY